MGPKMFLIFFLHLLLIHFLKDFLPGLKISCFLRLFFVISLVKFDIFLAFDVFWFAAWNDNGLIWGRRRDKKVLPNLEVGV